MTDTPEEVKLCECGGVAMLHFPEEFDNNAGTVMCNDCFRILERSDWREAIRDWNTRPTEEALRAKVEALEERLQDADEAIEKIEQWASAYPVEIFTVPTAAQIRRAAMAVKEHTDITSDALHGHWARHILSGVENLARTARQALKDPDA